MFGDFYFGQPFFAQGTFLGTTPLSVIHTIVYNVYKAISGSEQILFNDLKSVSASGGHQILFNIYSDAGLLFSPQIIYNINGPVSASNGQQILYTVLGPISAAGGHQIIFDTHTLVNIISSTIILYDVHQIVSGPEQRTIIFNVDQLFPANAPLSAQIIFDDGSTYPPIPFLKEIRYDVLNKKPYIITVVVSGSPCPLSTIGFILSG